MGAMAHLEFIIEPEERRWKVTLGGSDQSCGFPDRLAALRAAVRDAERVRDLGHEVRVFVRRENGKLRRVSIGEPPRPTAC